MGVANVKRELLIVGSVPWFASGNAVLASLSLAAAPLVQVAGMLGYSNEDNPFGDTNLSQQFVWNKKLQKEQMETKSGGVLCGPGGSCVALVSAYHRPDPTPCPYPRFLLPPVTLRVAPRQAHDPQQVRPQEEA